MFINKLSRLSERGNVTVKRLEVRTKADTIIPRCLNLA